MRLFRGYCSQCFASDFTAKITTPETIGNPVVSFLIQLLKSHNREVDIQQRLGGVLLVRTQIITVQYSHTDKE